MKFLQMPDSDRKDIYQEVANKRGLPPQAIEKDVWVTLMLRAVFSSEHAKHLVFKGGTSLSKGYGLINRFSEDVDLAVSRSLLGFGGNLSKGEIRKLRRACHSYVANEFSDLLRGQLTRFGVSSSVYDFAVENTDVSDQDPETLQVNFHSLFDSNPYLPSNIKIEVGGRSLMKPFTKVPIQSWVDTQFPALGFSELPFVVSAADPEKTFLEKLILLHEEFQKPKEKVRWLRMSRHLYDIGQIMMTKYGESAMLNTDLFECIIAHRRVFTPMKSTNYDVINIGSLDVIPPTEFIGRYRSDYQEMQSSMIHSRSDAFDELIGNIRQQLLRYSTA
jgi:hypothetical protein